jgi:ketosteroid isomerase-like protein
MTPDDMRALLDRFYAGFAAGDISGWTGALTDDAVGIGTDATEFWTSSQEIVRIGTAQVKEMTAAGVRVSRGDAKVFADGDAGWAVDRPIIAVPGADPLEARLTLVATDTGGDVRLRHFHLSVGEPNGELLGQELTTD